MSRFVLKLVRRASPSCELTQRLRLAQGRADCVWRDGPRARLGALANCLWAFNRRKPLVASCIAAAVQRSAIDASRQRLTLRQTRRMAPIMFSMMLVQASERRSD